MKKLLIKLIQATTVAAVLSAVFIGLAGSKPADAAAPGQIVGGNQNYKIANVTKGLDFANPQTADACDVLEYRIRLYNPGPSALSDVRVEASINTMTKYTAANSTATIYVPEANKPIIGMQATLNISTPQTQSYVAQSTQLLDSAGGVVKSSAAGTLADTITMGAGGIQVGPVGESVTYFLKFRTKLSCPQPSVPNIRCDALDVQKLSRTSFRFTGRGTAVNATITGYIFSMGNTVAQDSASNVYTLNQETPGTYTVSLIVKTDQGNTQPTAACTKQVVVESPPCVNNPETPQDDCNPCVNNPNTPEDDCTPCVNNPNTPQNECAPCHNNPQTPEDECKPCRDNSNMPGNSCAPCYNNPATTMDECKPTTPTTPGTGVTELANTGPGAIAAAFAGVTSLSSVAYYFARRKFGLGL